MILANVLTGLKTQLDTISGLQTYAFPPSSVVPPAAVFWPDRVDYDLTDGRGFDQFSLNLWLVTGQVDDETAWTRLFTWGSGSGSESAKQVLESHNYSYSAFDHVTVTEVTFDEITIAGTSYLAALFVLNIVGSGS